MSNVFLFPVWCSILLYIESLLTVTEQGQTGSLTLAGNKLEQRLVASVVIFSYNAIFLTFNNKLLAKSIGTQ